MKRILEILESHFMLTNTTSKVPVILPWFVIKNLSGQSTEWQSFKQSFNEAIDKHPGL